MLYADDINLFLGSKDSVLKISDCLTTVSYAIGSKFNMDKTDIKPVGPHAFQLACYNNQDMDRSCLLGAHILPPADPLRILGVWVGSRNLAMDRWTQIDKHVKKIISQWHAIGASVQNRSLLAKALMLSRCHFLLDGNGIPPSMLNKIGNKIMNFVRGKFSAMAYRTLEAPLAEGGINTPSLATRKMAVDLKFLSDLITGDQQVPWKQWTWMDLKMASASSRAGTHGGINPFLQQAHMMPSLLQDRVSQAFMTARKFRLDLACMAPSAMARMEAPILNHPALPRPSSQRFLKLLNLQTHRVSKVIHLYAPPPLRGSGLIRTVRAMKEVVHASSWSLLLRPSTAGLHQSVNIWPNMDGPLGCVRVFTAPKSLITGRIVRDAYKWTRVHNHMVDYTPAVPPAPRQADNIVYEQDIHIWTDGSAKDNGTDVCTAGSAWVSDLQFEDKVSLTGLALSNNIAEVAAVVLCLMAWRDAHIVIHTDSTFVLGLLQGGLLAMERDGWGDAPRHLSRGPPTPLLQQLLFLLRSRTGRLRFEKAKAHSNDNMNNIADALANEGRLRGRVFDISSLKVPAGWIDTAPVLCHQPLHYITKLVVRARVPAPAKMLKFESFSDRWIVTIGNMFGMVLDPGTYIGKVWSLPIPEGLKEVLWKEMNGAQVLGHRYFGTGHAKSDMVRICKCRVEMSLGHILVGCADYKLQPLMEVLLETLANIYPGSGFKTLTPDAWGVSPWYLMLALGELEEHGYPIVKGRKKILKKLKETRQQCIWVIGNYYWSLWKWRMKEVHDTDFRFLPIYCADLLHTALSTPIPAHMLQTQGSAGDRPPTPGADVRLPATMPGQHRAAGHGTGRRDAMGTHLSPKGERILRAIIQPTPVREVPPLSRRNMILRTLTDDAYA